MEFCAGIPVGLLRSSLVPIRFPRWCKHLRAVTIARLTSEVSFWKTVETFSSPRNSALSSLFLRPVNLATSVATSLTDHPLFNLDLTFGKRFHFDETRNLEFRMEAQNATNTPSFLVPDGNLVLTSGSFGQVLGTTASSSRKIQFAMKFHF